MDGVGRVLDFSEIGKRLCNWVEEVWDHKFIIYEKDPLADILKKEDPFGVWLSPFNPTAENFAEYLVKTVGPQQLPLQFRATLIKVKFQETRKCTATYSLEI